MTDAQISAWLGRILEKGKTLGDYYLNTDLDDSAGWGGRLEAFLRRPPERQPSGLLLTGPEGCGKHNCVGLLLQSLCVRNYGTVFLSGADLPQEEGFTALRMCLNALLERFADEEKNLCLVLEGLEGCPLRRELLDYLGLAACEYLEVRNAGGPDLFLAVIAGSDEEIPALLRSRLQIFRVSQPDERQRARYWRSAAPELTELIPLQELVELTEGMSFSQLVGAVDLALLNAQDRQDDGQKELRALLKSQRPQRDLRSELPDLADKAAAFLDRLPELLQKLPAASVEPAKTAQPASALISAETGVKDEEAYLKDERKRLENLSLRDLALETFGKETGESFLKEMEAHALLN